MTRAFEPRLAASVKADEKKGQKYLTELMKFVKNDLRFPVYASPKLDGIRGVVHDSTVKSRTFIPIPNHHIQSLMGMAALAGCDNEIIVGAPNTPDTYNRSFRGVMTEEGLPDFKFHLFDIVPEFIEADLDKTYRWRLDWITEWYEDHKKSYGHLVELVPQKLITKLDDLLDFEEESVVNGYEGVITACPKGIYKYGRSTLREQYLFKLVRKETEEFKIVGFNEQMHNGNEAGTNNFGRTKRSTHRENKTGKGILGSFVLEIPKGHPKFPAGTFDCNGRMDVKFRKKVWENKEDFIHEFAKVEHRPYGAKDAPRFPVFIGMRARMDM